MLGYLDDLQERFTWCDKVVQDYIDREKPSSNSGGRASRTAVMTGFQTGCP